MKLLQTKIRFVENKNFSFDVYNKQDCLVSSYLKKVVSISPITEGECDAMACYELMQSKWACVSLKRGASGAVKDIRESIEYVESFDNIVICFDNDKAGREAARDVARILKPEKLRSVTFPNGYKDANDMLRQKRFQEFMSAWWESRTYTPSGIIELSAQKKDWLHREKREYSLSLGRIE